MTRKHWLLAGLAVLLGGFSLYLNRDWFAGDVIHVYHRSSPRPNSSDPRSPDSKSPSAPILFGFDRKLELTEVKVLALHELQTNKYPHPLWHLKSSSNSVPTKTFNYGSRIRGMQPAVKGAVAQPLLPGVQYRLQAHAGKTLVEHDFEPIPRWR